MIPIPSGVRVWIATAHTDMRRGMKGLALQVQQALKRDPHAGDLFVFRGRRGNLVKVFWHYTLGMSLYAKRLERGKFIWPSPADGVVVITPAQLAYMLEGIDWRHPQRTWRPRRRAWAGACPGFERRGFDCASAVGNREDAARALWPASRAQGAASRPDGARVGKTRSCGRRR